MREKQAENEAVEMARERESREKEVAEGDKYSIRRCVSVINTMELTKGEKAKAIAVIAKSKDSREAFLCTFEVDQECALIWLKNEMAQQVCSVPILCILIHDCCSVKFRKDASEL
jgi:hypothetical protein